MADQQKFWLVWDVGGYAPKRQHWTKEAAQNEAQRLASNNPGKTFAIMSCVGAYVCNLSPVEPVKIVKRPVDLERDIPF